MGATRYGSTFGLLAAELVKIVGNRLVGGSWLVLVAGVVADRSGRCCPIAGSPSAMAVSAGRRIGGNVCDHMGLERLLGAGSPACCGSGI